MSKRILVVNDDSSARESLAHTLADADYEVMLAGDTQAALAVIRKDFPDLVLLDLEMSGRSGWLTFEDLVKQRPLLPILVLTAKPNQRFLALGAGAGGLLEKPLDHQALLKAMRSLLLEPGDNRWARMAGRPAIFHYQKSSCSIRP